MRAEPPLEEEQLSPASPRTVTCASPAPSIFLKGKEEQPMPPSPRRQESVNQKGSHAAARTQTMILC